MFLLVKPAARRELVKKLRSPEVTIAILCFNTAKFSIAALESVIGDGFESREIICIDDGSDDGSTEIFARRAKELGAKFIENQSNMGIPYSCNLALSQASGEFLIILGDDILLGNRISGDVEVLRKNPNCGFACSSVKLIGPEGFPLKGFENWENSGALGEFLENPKTIWGKGSSAFSPTVTYRKKVLSSLGGWDEDFPGPDNALFIRFALASIKGYRRPEVTTLYRRHPGNYTSRFDESFLQHEIKLIDKYQLKIGKFRILLRAFRELHYKMLFQGRTISEASRALDLAGLRRYSWLLSSRIIRFMVIILALTKKTGFEKMRIRGYLRGLPD